MFRSSIVALLWLVAASGSAADSDAAGVEFFEAKIRPVLVEHCYECHSSRAKTVQGGLLLDHREGLLKGGDSGPALNLDKPAESLLLKALRYDGVEMPPKGKLPAHVVADIERWVQLGAPDPREGSGAVVRSSIDLTTAQQFWAFQPPRSSSLPAVQNEAWPQRDLDRFVLAALEKNSLAPSRPADRRTLMRRAYFDLIGLPPTPAEVEAFLADSSPDAFAAVVDRLLDSPHYGERWGRHWLDVARYGEDQAHTFKARNYPNGYRYRDWVVSALNQDLPYDRFVREQIAGDLLGDPQDPERLRALGLFALGPVYYQDNGEQAKATADEWDDRVDTLTRGVLGLTVACSRCHDHKFDPITTADYYGLAGIFASSEYQERPIVSANVLAQKSAAEATVKAHQLQVDRFLDDESRKLRTTLVADCPNYFVAAWKVLNRQKVKPGDKKLLAEVAKGENVSEFLLKRWVDYLGNSSAEMQASRTYLAAWFELLRSQDSKQDLSGDEAARTAVKRAGEEFLAQVQSKLGQRERLARKFGENVAFVSEADRATVEPGIIPLGNLFDDPDGVSLSGALSSDKFRAVATDKSLAVDRVVQGWGKQTQIAPDIRFEFTQLGSDGRTHGGVVNDGWDETGGIRTLGERCDSKIAKSEQGIGMHANALITFDLEELRRAGLLPSDQRFVLRVDRAGLNDDVFGGDGPSAHLAVIISRPHRQNDVYDAILSGYVNGVSVKVSENDRVYYFSGDLPPPMKADGKFATLNVPIAADAKFLTLVTTGAGQGAGDNTINSDHAVFSGVRLEMDPPPPTAVATTPSDRNVDSAPGDDQRDRVDARLLSELFYDQGLLALPGAEADKRLPEGAAQKLASLKTELERCKRESDAIQIAIAHSLVDGRGQDLKIYLQGNPKKLGELVPRSLPAVFTGGQRTPISTKGSGRAELAQALASRENPLTARVMVNRVWRGHFGFGLVRTPSNFGQLGDRPTHPELLDFLSVRFMDSGWSLKKLHREIMLSATYQQSSAGDAPGMAVDPENRLLWRMNRRRLEVEPWRDAMLAVSGELDPAVGGPPLELSAANNRRRTLYAFISRHQLNYLLRLFDFPDPNITSDRRSVTTVPLQQLFVLNSDFMVQRAKALAARLNSSAAQDSEKIQRAFELLFSRPAAEEELRVGLSFLTNATAENGSGLNAWEQYTLALLGTNEFTFVD